MERLLADAEKLTGVHYDINNLADVYTAINEIQKSLDVAGTTSEEAATTLSGSASAMSSAWKNLLGQMALGGDLEEPLKNLVESASTFLFDNLIPMIGNIVSKLPSMIWDALPVIVPALLKAGGQLLIYIAQGTIESIPHMIQAVKDLAQQVIDFFQNVDWGEVGEYIVKGIGDGLAAMGGWLWEQAKSLGNGLKEGLCDLFGIHSPSKWAKNMIGANIVAGIGQGMTNKKAKKTISGSVLGVQDTIKNIYKKGKNLPNIIPSTFNIFKKLTKVTPSKKTSGAVSTAQGGGTYGVGGASPSGTPNKQNPTKKKVTKVKTTKTKARPFYMFDIDGYKFGLATAHSFGQASVKVNEAYARR